MIWGQRRKSGRFERIVKFAAGVVVGASLSCALASAATVVRHDGAFWKGLGNQDKTAFVDGYSDAMRTNLGKLDQLKIASALLHWKGAGKILNQVARGMDLSSLPAKDLVAYLDNLYSNRQYGDFDVANAIELAAMRGLDGQPLAKKQAPSASSVQR